MINQAGTDMRVLITLSFFNGYIEIVVREFTYTSGHTLFVGQDVEIVKEHIYPKNKASKHPEENKLWYEKLPDNDITFYNVKGVQTGWDSE